MHDKHVTRDHRLPSESMVALLSDAGEELSASGYYRMPSSQELAEAYAAMVTGRRINDQASALVRQGRLAVYPSSHGQEACQIAQHMF